MRPSRAARLTSKHSSSCSILIKGVIEAVWKTLFVACVVTVPMPKPRGKMRPVPSESTRSWSLSSEKWTAKERFSCFEDPVPSAMPRVFVLAHSTEMRLLGSVIS